MTELTGDQEYKKHLSDKNKQWYKENREIVCKNSNERRAKIYADPVKHEAFKAHRREYLKVYENLPEVKLKRKLARQAIKKVERK